MRLLLSSFVAATLFTAAAAASDLVELNPAGLPGLVPWSSPEVSVREDGGAWVAAFTGGTGPRTAIYLRKVSKSDLSMSEAQAVSPVDGNPDSQPSLWIDSRGDYHCVWTTTLKGRRAYQVFYSRRKAGSEQWSTPHLFSTGSGMIAPRILGDEAGNLFVHYWNNTREDSKGRVFLFASRDSGSTWNAASPGFPPEERKGSASELRASLLGDGSLGLLWLDHSPGGLSVVFNRGTEGGSRWFPSPTTVNTDRTYAASNPRLLTVGARVHAFWTVRWLRENGPTIQFWSAHSLDEGRNFSHNQLLYEVKTEQLEVELFEGEGEQVGVVWVEKLPPKEDRMPGGGRIQEMVFWDGQHYLESPEARELAESSERSFSDLRVAGKGKRMLVVASDLNPFEPSRVHVFAGDGEGGATSMILEAKTSPHDARGPIVFIEKSDQMYTIVFHEMRRSRFIMEPPPSDTTILWGQYRFHATAGTTR